MIIDREGLQELQTRIKNPLESIFDKFEKKGTLSFEDVKEEYDFMFRFLEDVQNWSNDTITAPDPVITVNGKNYKAGE